jgi:hypothetical protein
MPSSKAQELEHLMPSTDPCQLQLHSKTLARDKIERHNGAEDPF